MVERTRTPKPPRKAASTESSGSDSTSSARARSLANLKPFRKGQPKPPGSGRKKTKGAAAIVDRFLDIVAEERGIPGDRDTVAAQLMATMLQSEPKTMARVITERLVPKASIAPVCIDIDTDDLPGSMERIVKAMASGGDITALTALHNACEKLIDARALALELALAKELEEKS